MSEDEILDAPDKIDTSIKDSVQNGITAIFFLSIFFFLNSIIPLFIAVPIIRLFLILTLLIGLSIILYLFIKKSNYAYHKLIKVVLPTSLIIFLSIIFTQVLSSIFYYCYLGFPSNWSYSIVTYLKLIPSSFLWGWMFSFGLIQWIRHPKRKWILILINIGFFGIYFLFIFQ